MVHTSRSKTVPNSRTRILFLSDFAYMGGGEVVLSKFMKYLNRNLIEPIAIVARAGPLVEQLRSHGVETYIMPVDSRDITQKIDRYDFNIIRAMHTLHICIKRAYRVASFAKSNAIDKIYCNCLRTHIYGTLAGYCSNIPVIWRYHSILAKDRFIYPIRKLISFLGNRRIVAKILAVSQAVEKNLKKEGIKNQKIQIIYNGIETFYESTSKNKLRQEYRIPTTAKLIGMIGRVMAWKGQKTVIEAVSKVLKDIPDVVLFIIGAGFSKEEKNYEESLKKLSEDLGIKDQIVFTGFKEDIFSILNELCLVVHASLEADPLPTVILEAMAAAKPIIASNSGGVPEMIEHEKTGLLFPCGDSNALAYWIRYALSNEEEMRQLGKRARKVASVKFSIEKYVSSMEEALINK